jgi:hypothetical protein
MRRHLRFVLLFLPLATLGAKGCDNDLVDDPTFRDWCGDKLCAWTLDEGAVQRAPTWHPDDYGVAFTATPTAISQSVSNTPRCLEFTTVADVDPSAQMTIGIDFNRDGTIDHEEPIAATGFHPAHTEITAPLWYDGFRIVLTKHGAGKAVLAQMRVQGSKACSAPPVALHDLPLGATCSNAEPSACGSGICCGGVCSECCPHQDIGQVLPDGGLAMSPQVDCADGKSCKAAAEGIKGFFQPTVPWQCDPGKNDRASGAVCVGDDDCTSNVCAGAKSHAWRSDPSVDGGVATCDGAHFPDAGGSDCIYDSVTEGRCQ